MKKSVALIIANQLNIQLPAKGTVDALFDLCSAKGLAPGICHQTGDWVVVNSDREILARAS